MASRNNREFDESDARVRPARRTKPRTKDRPAHKDAVKAFVTTVDRGRTTCVLVNGKDKGIVKGYEISYGSKIRPIIYSLKKDGTPSIGNAPTLNC